MNVMRHNNRFLRAVTAALILAIGGALFSANRSLVADDEIDLSQYYGFRPLEIFKLERRSHSMLTGDFNHDGRTDLAVVDNSHSRIDLLLQREGPPDETTPTGLRKPNDISSHWRFEHVKIPVDRNVSAMAVGDFNSDGRADLAYFGDPDRLVLRFQPESGDWTDSRQIRLADVEGQAWGIAAGDLDGDGRDDVAVLGTKVTYVIRQTSPGKFDPPEEIRNTAERLTLAMIGDLDGDGRNDLFYTAADGNERRASARLQNNEGRLGPEIRFDLKDTRGLILFDIADGAGREVVTIDGTTGRLRVAQFEREGDFNGKFAARLVQYGFGESGGASGRDLATGDLNGDGLTDVVVTDPNAAQLIVFLQHESYGLDLGTTYPSFLGAAQVRIADIDGDGHAEVFVLSNKERSIGLCEFKNDRLTFPTTLPISGEPVAFELADLNRDGRLEIVYLEKTGRKAFVLHQLVRENGDDWQSHPLGADDGKLSLDSDPGYIRAIDANGDGRTDLLLTDPARRKPTLLVTNADGVPELVEAVGGVQLGDIDRGAVFSGKLDEPVTLVAQGNFARSVRLEDGRWQVLDQFNPDESGAKIVGAATLDLDGEPGNELVLIDTGVNKLRIMRKEGELYQSWEQVDIGRFPFLAAHVADLNHDQRDDLVLFGEQRFLTLYAGEHPPVLRDVMSFESSLDEDEFFVDLVGGDLNGDGQPDVAMFDVIKHNLEIVTRRGDQLVHAISFKVFEEKNFGRRSSDGAQPREAVVADVTGDGRDDLILLVHDRVIVYPQDDGAAFEPDAAAEKTTRRTTPETSR